MQTVENPSTKQIIPVHTWQPRSMLDASWERTHRVVKRQVVDVNGNTYLSQTVIGDGLTRREAMDYSYRLNLRTTLDHNALLITARGIVEE